MSTPTMSRFFATLALVTFAASVAVGVLAVASRRSPSARERLDHLGASALWLASLVAIVTTLGSLYYSLIAHFEPCELCWYQRICMYPLAVILPIAAWRDDRGIWRYLAPQVAVGIVIAAYHSQLQAWPSQSSFCSAVVPCNLRDVWEFGFVSLPLMDLAALMFIASMLLLVRRPLPTEVAS